MRCGRHPHRVRQAGSRAAGPRGPTSWYVGAPASRGAWATGISGCSATRGWGAGRGPRKRSGLRRASLGRPRASEEPRATARPGATAGARARRLGAPSASGARGAFAPAPSRSNLEAAQPALRARGRGRGRGGGARARSPPIGRAWEGLRSVTWWARRRGRPAPTVPRLPARGCARTSGLVGALNPVETRDEPAGGPSSLLGGPWGPELLAARARARRGNPRASPKFSSTFQKPWPGAAGRPRGLGAGRSAVGGRGAASPGGAAPVARPGRRRVGRAAASGSRQAVAVLRPHGRDLR